MKFESGKSGNPKGRPKGSKNKPVRTKIESLIKRNITKIEQEIDTTTPEQRRGFLVNLSAALSITQIAQQDEAGI